MHWLRARICDWCWNYLWKHWPDRFYLDVTKIGVSYFTEAWMLTTNKKVAKSWLEEGHHVVERLDSSGWTLTKGELE